MRVCKRLEGRRKEIETRNGRREREREGGRGETMRRPGTEEGLDGKRGRKGRYIVGREAGGGECGERRGGRVSRVCRLAVLQINKANHPQPPTSLGPPSSNHPPDHLPPPSPSHPPPSLPSIEPLASRTNLNMSDNNTDPMD